MSGDIQPEIGRVLKKVYDLPQIPRSVGEFLKLLHSRHGRPEVYEYVQRVKREGLVWGESPCPTRHKLTLKDGREKYAACAVDAIYTGILHGDLDVASACPYCGKLISIRFRGGDAIYFSPGTAVFRWGVNPEDEINSWTPEIVMRRDRPRPNFFFSEDHLNLWIRSAVPSLTLTPSLFY